MKKLFYTLFFCTLIGLTTTSCVEKTYYIYETTDEEGEDGSESGENATENENENDNSNESDINPDNDTTLDYSYSTAYFAQQQPLRTSIADRAANEGNGISVGAAIGGKTEVDINDWAKFIINEDLLTNTELYPNGTGLVLMPKEYYYLSNESVMTVTNSALSITSVDIYFTDDFYADPLAVNSYYAIPFELTDTSCDAILESREYSIVAVKYQSKYHGTYYVQGYTFEMEDYDQTTGVMEFSANGSTYYYSDLSQNVTCEFETIGRYTVSRTGQSVVIGNSTVNNGSVDITVEASGEITVTASSGNSEFISGSGVGTLTYDEESADCVIEIEYVFKSGDLYYYVNEKLTRRQDPFEALRIELWTAPGEV